MTGLKTVSRSHARRRRSIAPTSSTGTSPSGARSGCADDAVAHVKCGLRHVTRDATFGAEPIGSQGWPLVSGVRKAKQQQPLTRPRRRSPRNGAAVVSRRASTGNSKKGGGERPIAVKEFLLRAATGALIRSSINDLRNIPRQFVLRSDGCLAVALLMNSAIKSDNALRNPDWHEQRVQQYSLKCFTALLGRNAVSSIRALCLRFAVLSFNRQRYNRI